MFDATRDDDSSGFSTLWQGSSRSPSNRKVEEASFAANLANVIDWIGQSPEAIPDLRWQLTRGDKCATRAFRFLDHMRRKVKDGDLSDEHREALLHLPMTVAGMTMYERLTCDSILTRKPASECEAAMAFAKRLHDMNQSVRVNDGMLVLRREDRARPVFAHARAEGNQVVLVFHLDGATVQASVGLPSIRATKWASRAVSVPIPERYLMIEAVRDFIQEPINPRREELDPGQFPVLQNLIAFFPDLTVGQVHYRPSRTGVALFHKLEHWARISPVFASVAELEAFTEMNWAQGVSDYRSVSPSALREMFATHGVQDTRPERVETAARKSIGTQAQRADALAGQRFGRLHVLSETRMKDGHRQWKCKCVCGQIKWVRADVLLAAKSSTCGCGTR